MTKSTDGRKWARLSKLKPGDKIKADSGFTCIKPGAIRTVRFTAEDGFFVKCTSGWHLLDGQLDKDNDSIIGFWPVP